MTLNKLDLQSQYARLECEKLAALNGFGRKIASKNELAKLEDELQVLRKHALEAGIDLIEFEAFVVKVREVNERRLRRYAASLPPKKFAIGFITRKKTAIWMLGISGATTVMLALASFTWWPVVGLLGLLLTNIFDTISAKYFSTNAFALGRMSAEAGVDISNLWTGDLQSEYFLGMANRIARLKKTGRLIRFQS